MRERRERDVRDEHDDDLGVRLVRADLLLWSRGLEQVCRLPCGALLPQLLQPRELRVLRRRGERPGQPAELYLLLLRHLLRDGRTRSNDAHLSSQHIDELRQLVKTRFPQESPYPGDDSGIILNLKYRSI